MCVWVDVFSDGGVVEQGLGSGVVDKHCPIVVPRFQAVFRVSVNVAPLAVFRVLSEMEDLLETKASFLPLGTVGMQLLRGNRWDLQVCHVLFALMGCIVLCFAVLLGVLCCVVLCVAVLRVLI